MNHLHHPARVATGLPDLADRLRREDRKITGPRQSILALLRQQTRPLSPKEIFVGLAPAACNLATVYRCLHLLARMGMVKRYDFGDGVARYELLAEGDDGHRHHLICTRCDSVVELEDCFPAEWEQRIAAAQGFAHVTHRLEFFGLCPRCQVQGG